MVSIGNRKRSARLQCGTYKESGSCANSRKVNRDAIEAAVFAGLKDELSNPIAATNPVASRWAARANPLRARINYFERWSVLTRCRGTGVECCSPSPPLNWHLGD
jgi:hypothetical protein